MLFNNIMQPDFGLFFWTLLVFAIVFFILRKFAWKPIINGIEERNKNIEAKLRSASAAESKMKELTARNEEIVQEARNERERIVREADQQKEKIVSDAKEEARKEADKIMSNARQQIEMEKNAAIAELKNQTVELAVEIAEKVLRQEMADKKKDNEYLKRLVSDIKLN